MASNGIGYDNGTKRHRLRVTVDERGAAVIERAITLRKASQGDLAESTPEFDGEVLAAIVGDWLVAESTRLHLAKGK